MSQNQISPAKDGQKKVLIPNSIIPSSLLAGSKTQKSVITVNSGSEKSNSAGVHITTGQHSNLATNNANEKGSSSNLQAASIQPIIGNSTSSNPTPSIVSSKTKDKNSTSQQNNNSSTLHAEQDKLLNPPSGEYVLKNQVDYLKRGTFYINKNQFDNALKIYELLNDANPNKGNAQILAGHCAFRLKKHEKVVSYYQKAMELSAKANKDPNIHFELGIAHYRVTLFSHNSLYHLPFVSKQGKFIESEQFFNKVNVYQQKYIYQPIVDLYKGIIKRQNGYSSEAAQVNQQLTHSLSFIQSPYETQQKQLFLSSLIQNDKNIFSQQKTVEILCNAGLQFENMKEVTFSSFQNNSNTLQNKVGGRVIVLLKSQTSGGNELQRTEMFELGVILKEELRKHILITLVNKIITVIQTKRESADLIQKAYQQNNKDFEILLILAKNYDQQGQVKQALEFFNKAIQLNNSNAICWCYLGITFFKLNMMKDAFSCFNKSFELENNIETLFNIALLYEIGKHFIEAINLYKQILMVCPDDHMVVRRKITIERNASSQTHDPFNKKQLNKLRTMLREPPFKPNVSLWLEELDPLVKQRLIEQERQELINSLSNNQIHLNQLSKSPLFQPLQKTRRSSIFNLHTPNANFYKEPFDSLLNTPNLLFQTPKLNYEQQFSLTPVNYPVNNSMYTKTKTSSNRSFDYIQSINQKRKIENSGSLLNIPLYGDAFQDPYTASYKPSPYGQTNIPFSSLYKNSFDNTDLYRNRTSSISPIPTQNLLKIEDQGFVSGYNTSNKMGNEDEDNPNNKNGGFKLRKNSEFDRQRKASIASNTSPFQRPVKKPSDNHSDSDSNLEKPLKKQIKIVSLSNPVLSNNGQSSSSTSNQTNSNTSQPDQNLTTLIVPNKNISIPTTQNQTTPTKKEFQQTSNSSASQVNKSCSNSKIQNGTIQPGGEVFYGSLMSCDDELNNAMPYKQEDSSSTNSSNLRFSIFSNLGQRNKQTK